jgi:hypothetical protein
VPPAWGPLARELTGGRVGAWRRGGRSSSPAAVTSCSSCGAAARARETSGRSPAASRISRGR